jgi:collagen type I/II/III/V/XI/XXIV/XXVII alpha
MTIPRWLLAIFTLCLYLPTLSASQLQFVSTESDPDAFIQNSVNVINGDYCESARDLVITGPDALVLQRFYSTKDIIIGVQAGGWRMLPQRFLVVGKDASGKSCTVGKDRFEWTSAFTGERSGGILPYTGWRNTNGFTKDPLKIDILNNAVGMVNP